jgi:predicted nucleotidyltransferase
MSANTDWHYVHEKRKRKRKPLKHIPVDYQLIKNVIPDVIEKYRPMAVFLYGSMAIGKQTPQSDIDLLFIWSKHVPTNVADIRDELANVFQRKVDLVNMVHTGRLEKDSKDTRDVDFLANVLTDAIPLYGDRQTLLESVLYGKTP